ncbi:sialate O-acetylesterase [Arcicella aquatica]|uniref:Sialate O-acetylesterase n=1 Tax=Arcicella aquatica TaxID=217141 RepID=A0ABU5QUK4_9BACT|nr:sialate O-acetylesterase [Arcicella aquatica]MEA5260790.1 sialate O-acetylesterase [Arcicella aquatica]
MKKIAFFIVVTIVFVTQTFAQVLEQVDSNFDIYVLMGQSNMAGRGKITEEYQKEANPNIFVLTKDNTWAVAKHPLHFDKPQIVGVGPGLQFALTMLEVSKTKKIGLVPTAVGGTSINLWKPNAYDASTKTHPFDDAVRRIKEAMQYGVIKGIIWLQGESDASPKKSENYGVKFKTMIDSIRVLVNNPKLPVILGELGQYRPEYVQFNHDVLKTISSTISNTALVYSKGLVHKGDTIHFDAPSAEMSGKRFGKAMIKLQKKNDKIK